MEHVTLLTGTKVKENINQSGQGTGAPAVSPCCLLFLSLFSSFCCLVFFSQFFFFLFVATFSFPCFFLFLFCCLIFFSLFFLFVASFSFQFHKNYVCLLSDLCWMGVASVTFGWIQVLSKVHHIALYYISLYTSGRLRLGN